MNWYSLGLNFILENHYSGKPLVYTTFSLTHACACLHVFALCMSMRKCAEALRVCECASVSLSIPLSLLTYILNHTGDSSSPSIQGWEDEVGVGEGRSEV